MTTTTHNAEAATVAELLDVHQTAELLNCSATTVRRLSHRGTIPSPIRLGALIRWRRRELLDWLESPAAEGIDADGRE